MAEKTGIAWTDCTFNPWRGCAKVSPGCANCYAETLSHRNPKVLGVWGKDGTRAVAAESYWRQPLKWARTLPSQLGRRPRVFCASLADVFEDRPDLDTPRQRLFDLILQTPQLDWLLLTKRPQVMKDYLTGGGMLGGRNEHEWGKGWPNVWLGTSVEDQARAAERIPLLLDVPAAVHWLSCEPLLGPVDLKEWLYYYHGHKPTSRWPCGGRVDWVVAGGESGGGARPCQVEWVRSLVAQCKAAGAACFVKQLGGQVRWMPAAGPSGLWPDHVRFNYEARGEASNHRIRLRDSKGGDTEEWPSDLRIRQFPTPR